MLSSKRIATSRKSDPVECRVDQDNGERLQRPEAGEGRGVMSSVDNLASLAFPNRPIHPIDQVLSQALRVAFLARTGAISLR